MEYQFQTDFASPERSEPDTLQWEIEYFKNMSNLRYFLDVVPTIVTVLNNNRQIVFANKTFSDSLGLLSPESLYGKRPGEALDCIYSSFNSAGCGTSTFCRNCQAVNSIILSLDGKISTSECTVMRNGMKSPLELRVYSHPFAANNSKYVVFSVTDISHEKRRRVLERSFFHDISNTLTGVQGYAEILQEHNLGEANEWVEKMMLCVNEAVEELMSQKSLLAAEDGELKVERKPVRSIEILEYVKNIFDCKNTFNNSRIVINQNSQNFNFVSDRTLLARVLINAVKNAVEASRNDSVLIGCSKINDGSLLFSVSNSQYIPEEIKNQIFKRSFSTKGPGRGLGTYSMKLLTERYLKGKIHFTSNNLDGTTFFIDLPLNI